ncbi:MAG: cupin domain-containing protein [Woeseiaceae bacterium]|nr:cupin domain-containing protein [Woeseiaceae bacterium]
MTERMTVKRALQAVAASDSQRYGVLLRHGTLEVGMYAPRGSDPQSPHEQDEVYVVQSGSGVFELGDDELEFEAGDALFVPAGVEHRFRDFGEDFAAWVIFYGPPGGEA